MNYYPYYSALGSVPAKTGLFSSIFSSLKNVGFSNIIANTSKTLGIINQTIPMIRQVTPIVNNAKTMFKVMNEFKKIDTPNKPIQTNINSARNNNKKESNIENDNNASSTEENINLPTFFI